MQDRKVIIYGLEGGDTPVAIVVTEDGFLTAQFRFSDGGTWNPLDPFSATIEDIAINAENSAPVLAFNFMYAGLDSGTGQERFSRMKACFSDSMSNPIDALMVAETSGELLIDAPAADTQAQVGTSFGVGVAARVTGFGFTITAVNAIVAPILVELRGDISGGNTLLWAGRYVVPAGQTVTVWIPGPFYAVDSAQVTVEAPGAGNFATASINMAGCGNSPS
jgi:hypothetical protein